MPVIAHRTALLPFSVLAESRSPSFVRLCERLERLQACLTQTADVLYASATQCLAPQYSITDRGHLLALRRQVFRRELLQHPHHSSYSQVISHYSRRYNRLYQAREKLEAVSQNQLLQEEDRLIQEVVKDQCLASALAYACPNLTHSQSANRQSRIAKARRTLYVYLTRATAKATPFHLFGSTSLHAAEQSCDALSVRAYMSRETIIRNFRDKAISGAVECFVVVEPYEMHQDFISFFTEEEHRIRVRSLPAKHVMQALLAYLIDSRRTESECRLFLTALCTEQSESEVNAFLALLFTSGILRRVPRTLEFPCDTFPVHVWLDQTPQRAVIPSLVHNEQAAAYKGLAASVWKALPASSYCVDSFNGTSFSAPLFDDVERQLHHLSGLLSSLNTYEGNEYRTNHALCSVLETDSPTSYLEVLRRLLMNAPELARLAEAAWAEHCLPLRRRFQSECFKQSGALSEELVQHLVKLRHFNGRRTPPLCALGLREGPNFYLSTILAGEGRFVRRLQVRAAFPSLDQAGETLVQLCPNVHADKTVPQHAGLCGFGFTELWRSQFERWIGPSNISVSKDAGNIITFRHSGTGERLHFAYEGILLAEHLPLQYRLLLQHHADAYHNPFTRSPGAIELVNDTPWLQDALHFKNLILRRRSLYLPLRLVCALFDNRTLLGSAIALYRLLSNELVSTARFFFYEIGSEIAQKPQLWDSQSLRSLQVLYATMMASISAPLIRFAEMDPIPNESTDGHVVEWLVEV